MKLKISKTDINKGFDNFVKNIEKIDEDSSAYRTSLYSKNNKQRISFIIENADNKSKSKFLFKF